MKINAKLPRSPTTAATPASAGDLECACDFLKSGGSLLPIIIECLAVQDVDTLRCSSKRRQEVEALQGVEPEAQLCPHHVLNLVVFHIAFNTVRFAGAFDEIERGARGIHELLSVVINEDLWREFCCVLPLLCPRNEGVVRVVRLAKHQTSWVDGVAISLEASWLLKLIRPEAWLEVFGNCHELRLVGLELHVEHGACRLAIQQHRAQAKARGNEQLPPLRRWPHRGCGEGRRRNFEMP
mmetsp:Transcript_84160/g.212221  ORF Transcript_84160/g.212221 Transcript_84160/m.212221 type:complete len:239 (-) Transcript_84160:215-931(-)